MSQRRSTRLGFVFAGLASLAVSGCTLITPQPHTITAVDGDATPVDSPAALEEAYVRQGPRFNQLGGEVPKAAPTPQVDEVEMDDISPG